MPRLPWTDLDVSALCLGGNVFGWTADAPTSFALLDRYVDATPSTVRPFVDTAESYGDGTSERILGDWMASRGTRDGVVVATKASRMAKEHPLAAGEILTAAERSLRNLQTDRIGPVLRALRRPDDAAGGDPHGVRRARAQREGPVRGRLELLAGAAGRGAGDLRPARHRPARGAPDALQPHGTGRVRGW